MHRIRNRKREAGQKKEQDQDKDKAKSASQSPPPAARQPALGSETEDLCGLAESQDRTQRRTQLLKLKAEAELARIKEQPPAEPQKESNEPKAGKDDTNNAADAKPKPVDPEKIKSGYQKAIVCAESVRGDGSRREITQTEGPQGCLPAG